jgi:hypothetical protein
VSVCRLNAIYYNIEKDIYSTVQGASMKIIKDNSAARYNTSAGEAMAEQEQQQWEMDRDRERYGDDGSSDSSGGGNSAMRRAAERVASSSSSSDSSTVSGVDSKPKTVTANSPEPPSVEQSLKIVSMYILATTLCRHGGSVTDGLKFFKQEIKKHEGAS